MKQIQRTVPSFGRHCLLRTVMYNKLCYFFFCLLIFILRIISHLLFALNSMSWNFGFSTILISKLHEKLGFFHIVSQGKSQTISLSVIELPNLTNLKILDKDSQIYLFKGTLHNGRTKTHLGYRSDTNKKEFIS